MEENEEKVTLTQRRTGRVRNIGSVKLERNKLEVEDLGEEETSPLKVIIWVLVVVLVAVGAFFGAKTLMKEDSKTDGDKQSEATPTPNPLDKLVGKTALADSEATNAKESSAYTAKDQTVGTKSTSNYEITSYFVQPYTTFVRLEFELSTEDDSAPGVPSTVLKYDADTLSFDITMDGTTDEADLIADDSKIDLDQGVIASISKTDDVFSVELNESTTFVMHTDKNMLYVDVKEIPVDGGEVEPTTNVTPSASVAPTKAPTTGDNSTNEFSKSEQTVSSGATGNVFDIKNYRFNEKVDVMQFSVDFVNGPADEFPKVTAKLEGNAVILTVQNVKSDLVIGNNRSSTQDFTAKGVTGNTRSVNITNSNNVTTYKLNVLKQTDFKLFKVDGENSIRVEIKQR